MLRLTMRHAPFALDAMWAIMVGFHSALPAVGVVDALWSMEENSRDQKERRAVPTNWAVRCSKQLLGAGPRLVTPTHVFPTARDLAKLATWQGAYQTITLCVEVWHMARGALVLGTWRVDVRHNLHRSWICGLDLSTTPPLRPPWIEDLWNSVWGKVYARNNAHWNVLNVMMRTQCQCVMI